jgi:hypothetical protein
MARPQGVFVSVYRQDYVREPRKRGFVDLTGCLWPSRPSVVLLSSLVPRHVGVCSQPEPRFFPAHRLVPRPSWGEENGTLSRGGNDGGLKRAPIPMNRDDDSLPSRRAPARAPTAPITETSLKTGLSLIPAESPKIEGRIPRAECVCATL